MPNGLERFLGEHLSDGEIVSEGSFTVNLEQARGKLIRFGVENPEKALLKLIQSFVAGCPCLIDIKMSSQSITIHVSRTDRLAKDLKFLTGSLGAALWSCVYSGFPQVNVAVANRAWTLEESGVQEANSAEFGVTAMLSVQLNFQTPKGFWQNLRARVKGRSTIAFSLSQYLRHCPVRIRLDQRDLRVAHYKTRGKTTLDLFLTGSPRTLSSEITNGNIAKLRTKYTFHKKQRFDSKIHDWNTFAAFFHPADPRLFKIASASWVTVKKDSILAHLRTLSSREKSGRLTYVQNGVVVGVRPFLANGVTSANGVDLDASGLALVINQKLEKFEEYLAYEFNRSVRSLKSSRLS